MQSILLKSNALHAGHIVDTLKMQVAGIILQEELKVVLAWNTFGYPLFCLSMIPRVVGEKK